MITVVENKISDDILIRSYVIPNRRTVAQAGLSEVPVHVMRL